MSKINILPAKVYNRIAAGEVVDRPYSVVKELVENSIDAGATEIEIYVEKGGKQLIRVVDNGSGIARDDLHAAFLPHATSKIAVAEDLENVMTLGFRGEAIASIASVSQMTIISKTESGKCYKLSCNAGEIGEIIETAGEKGTDVRVEMLFYETPVRLDFLKSDKAEESDITTFVSRFILNRSDIAFTYYVNGKKVLQSFGGGDEEAMVCVYGASILDNCYKIDAERNGIRVRGYIGNQNFYKPNKSYQCTFINGRYVVNTTVSSAISGAYNSYLMKRQYPFYVLHINMHPRVVDVNVHPNKTDVRFASNQTVYGSIYKIISGVLDGTSQALAYVAPISEPTPAPSFVEENQSEDKAEISLSAMILEKARLEPDKPVEKTSSVFDFTEETYKIAEKEIEEVSEGWRKGFTPKEELGEYNPDTSKNVRIPKNGSRKKDPEALLKRHPGLYFKRTVLEFDDPAYSKAKEEDKIEDYFETNKKYLEELERKSKQNKIEVEDCQYVGKLFNTYLLYERADDIYVIDQHAAHERLIFDRLKEKMQNRSVLTQPMLIPFEIKVNAFEGEFLRGRMEDIRGLGFEMQETEENLFAISAVPVDLQNIDLSVFFNDVLGDLHSYKGIKLDELLKDKLASSACKAAVKGGMDISKEEAESLLKQMDGDMGLKCPHGRPVVVKISRTQLEKAFKRIV